MAGVPRVVAAATPTPLELQPRASDACVSDPPLPAAEASSSSRGTAWLLLWDMAVPVHLPNTLQSMTTAIVALVVPMFARSMGASDTVVGLITSCSGLGLIVVDVPASMLVARLGTGAVMNLGMAVYAVAVLLGLAAQEPFLLAVSVFCGGCGVGIHFGARHRFLQEAVDRKLRGRLMALVGGGQRWGFVFGPFLGGALASQIGPRWALTSRLPLCGAVVACVAFSRMVRAVDAAMSTTIERASAVTAAAAIAEQPSPSTELESPQKHQQPDDHDFIGTMRRHGGIVMRVGGFAAALLAMRQNRRLFITLAGLNMGLTPTEVGGYMSASFAIDATLFFMAGLISDKFGRRYAAIPTTALMALAFGFMSVVSSRGSLLLTCLMFGFADACGSGLLLSLIADSAPKESGASVMGAMRMVQDFGSLIGPLIGGVMIDLFSFRAACLLMALIGVGASVWAWLMLPESPVATPAATPSVAPQAPPAATAVAAVAMVEAPPPRVAVDIPSTAEAPVRVS